jgi:hypothetical protein
LLAIQQGQIGIKKINEEKALTRYALTEILSKEHDQDKRREYLRTINNIDEQMKYTQKQLEYIQKNAERLLSSKLTSRVNPDSMQSLPREDFNVANEVLIPAYMTGKDPNMKVSEEGI